MKAQNHNNQIDSWLIYFADMVLDAQQYTINEINFIVEKGKFLSKHNHQMNDAQEKAVLRLFKAGTKGFDGGLSRNNYMSITKVTNTRTASRHLTDLVTKGILKTQGAGKYTRYHLNL